MSDTGEGDDGLDPAEAFERLGNETRVGILRALVEAGPGTTPTFSALRGAVGEADSGRFNYHLQRLVGHFIEQTEGGYALRYPGAKVAHAVLAGTYNERAHMEPVDVEGRCHDCGEASLRASYAGETFVVRCETCENVLVDVPFPPGAVSSREPPEVPAAFDRWSTKQAGLAAEGVCPECASEMRGSVMTDVPPPLDHEVLAAFECSVCRRRAVTSFGGVALHHPDVLAFHHRRDVHPQSRPYWTIEEIVSDRHTTVRGADPWRVEVRFHAADDVLAVTLDGDASVIDCRES